MKAETREIRRSLFFGDIIPLCISYVYTHNFLTKFAPESDNL